MAYMQHLDIRKFVEYFQFFWIQENPKPCETVTVPFVSALLSSHGTVRRGAIIVYMTKVSTEHQQVLSWPQNYVFELGSHKPSTICPDFDILNHCSDIVGSEMAM